jgi:hypothetical protein
MYMSDELPKNMLSLYLEYTEASRIQRLAELTAEMETETEGDN